MIVPDFLYSWLHLLQKAMLLAAPHLPAEAWWLPAIILAILFLASMIDAYSATVPDPLIFLGLIALIGMQGYYVDWPFAASQLTAALIAAFTIWVINEIWYRSTGDDALGMGDAKWTLLAVACFGTYPVVAAWGAGACLASVWMGILWAARYRVTKVYFAPFLFAGLLAGLYVLRLRPAGFEF